MQNVELQERLKKMCRDEFEAHNMYKFLADRLIRNERVRGVFKKASEDERVHYEVLREVVGECKSSVSAIRVVGYIIIYLIFGTTIFLKITESLERSALKSYNELSKLGGELSDRILKLIEDEGRHEVELINSLDERRVKYLGSIILGVSDALVELTGVYAGALGALSSTSEAGLIGVLAGISAALSMAVASYAQAKQEVGKSPRLAATFTGLAYLTVVALLAIPYFITTSLIMAFSSMLVIALIVIAYMTYSGAVIYGRNFLREFGETSALLLGVAFLLYILGNLFGEAVR